MGNLTALSTDDLPPDVHFFAQLTVTDHSGVVWVVCIMSLTYALLCSSVRFILRRGMYSFDDAALLVSTLACIVQHTFVFIALRNGLGLSSSINDPKHREALANVSNAKSIEAKPAAYTDRRAVIQDLSYSLWFIIWPKSL